MYFHNFTLFKQLNSRKDNERPALTSKSTDQTHFTMLEDTVAVMHFTETSTAGANKEDHYLIKCISVPIKPLSLI